MRSFVAEAFSGLEVEAVLCQGYLFVCDFFKLAVFGKELANQAIQIFVSSGFIITITVS